MAAIAAAAVAPERSAVAVVGWAATASATAAANGRWNFG